MKRKITTLAITALATTAALLSAVPVFSAEGHNHKAAEHEEVKVQATCPVMGGKINRDLFVEANGKRVYVCCKGCLPKVKENPEKYIQQLETEGVQLEKVQTECPVMGGKISKKLYADVQGQRVYVCCAGCIGKVKEHPEKYLEKLDKQGVTPEPLPQPKDEKHTEKPNHDGHGHH